MIYNKIKKQTMKRFNFLLVAIALVLTVTAVSCTTMAGSQDEYYGQDRVYSNRVYVDDPYRGTVVLERDPRTGRYYEVSNYDPYYNGYYGNRYSRGYRTSGNGYPSYRRNGVGYNNNSSYNNGNNSNNNQNNDRSSEQYKRNRDEARSKVLGGSH
jgi:hypothetical protein